MCLYKDFGTCMVYLYDCNNYHLIIKVSFISTSSIEIKNEQYVQLFNEKMVYELVVRKTILKLANFAT